MSCPLVWLDFRRGETDQQLAASSPRSHWLCCGLAPRRAGPDPGDLAEGLRHLNKETPGMPGWAGDGRKMDSQMLTGQPAESGSSAKPSRSPSSAGVRGGACRLDRFAYSDGRCWHEARQPQVRALTPPDPPATLQPREVDLLVVFLLLASSERARWTGRAVPSTGARRSRLARNCPQLSEKTNK